MTTDFEKVFTAATNVLPQLITRNTSMIHAWLQGGCDPETDIIPTITRLAAKKPDIGGFSYFTGAVMKARDERLAAEQRLAASSAPVTPASEERWAKGIAYQVRVLGMRFPHEERRLADYEAKHGRVAV